MVLYFFGGDFVDVVLVTLFCIVLFYYLLLFNVIMTIKDLLSLLL